jgi:hypothetical protein
MQIVEFDFTAFSFSLVLTLLAEALLFEHRKKARGLKSGEKEDQDTGSAPL